MKSLKKLARVLTEELHGEFCLTLEAEDGEAFGIRMTEKQIEDLIQELDDLLGDDTDEEDAATERKEMGDE
ncbi:hypothetical protein [Methylorubrum extorquens]|uniref:hypothetical protein n=1 Tax=Methylorubrum extorquens TaxID=408 RepID=UPI0002F4D6F3|nr:MULTISPECIES: hypothetical protein [Methylobacteriaceae]KQP88971.1 hypothetical protein ASF55_04315 [Methylobacterium sp. Leaf119]KQQ13682.1 hypothetical protein ASF56_24385 [Methylobacterium sp. Leaf122]WIU40544.1 hypothetical protein KQ926_04180 [Methylorubrum extorquens]